MRHPAIAVCRGPASRGVPIAANADGRIRLLYRLVLNLQPGALVVQAPRVAGEPAHAPTSRW